MNHLCIELARAFQTQSVILLCLYVIKMFKFSGRRFVPLTMSTAALSHTFAISFSDNYKEPVNCHFYAPPPPPLSLLHITPEKFKNATISGYPGFVFEKLELGNHGFFVTSSFSKSSVFKIFPFTQVQMQSRRFSLN